MRRKMKHSSNSVSRAFIYICCLIALLVYAIPKIPSLHPGFAGTFSMIWILFAGLALAANFYFFLGADKERSRMLEAQQSSVRRIGEAQVRERSYQ